MNKTIRFVLAQLNFFVGDIEGNANKIVNAIKTAKNNLQADVIIFPELALVGYPPQDLLFRSELFERIEQALIQIKSYVDGIDVILGLPEYTPQGTFNKAILIRRGEIIAGYHKQKLPNDHVFDEVRYFKAGSTPCIVDIDGLAVAITICEDLWFPEPMQQAVKAGAQLVISLNASPFSIHKADIRAKTIGQRACEGRIPIIYVNCVGGQDELVFDGGSMVLNADGKICQQAEFFQESLFPIDIIIDKNTVILPARSLSDPMSLEERVYKALVLGLSDYFKKNCCQRAVLGLSGGIDSALTLAIAVDALGKENVEAVMMPSRYTSDLSLQLAQEQATRIGVHYSVISIEPIFQAFLQSLKTEFADYHTPDVTEENIQARCRGTLLMAIANKKCALVLATGNKSEMAVGYSTLYGDMVGGFCVIKDIFKTWVYKLAHYRNQLSPVIPKQVINRPPSAELASNQKDEDSLPPYALLDQILERYIEHDQSFQTIVAAGFDAHTVRKVILMINRNEYKRQQAALGVRITERAFGKDRRYPISSGFIKSLYNLNQ